MVCYNNVIFQFREQWSKFLVLDYDQYLSNIPKEFILIKDKLLGLLFLS